MVGHGSDGLQGIGWSNGYGDDDLSRVFASDSEYGSLHGGSGRQSVVDEDCGAAVECWQWSAAAEAADSFPDGSNFVANGF